MITASTWLLPRCFDYKHYAIAYIIRVFVYGEISFAVAEMLLDSV